MSDLASENGETSGSLPVPRIESPLALKTAEEEQEELYPNANFVRQRRDEIELKRLELENNRLEKQIATADERERAEMKTRHQLARFLIFGVLPVWLITVFGIFIACGAKWISLEGSVLIGLTTANPLGVGALLVIVCKYFFPTKDDSAKSGG